MGIEDIQISEELETNAPSIKYSGNEGPKSPQEMEQMIMASLEEEYAKYVFEMQEQGLEPMSMQKFIEQAMAEGQMSGGQPLPNDPTKPVNPFQPKPTGPVLPDRQMAAYGGIMGLDGRKKYGIGSWFQENIMDPIKENPEIAAAAALYGLDTFEVPGVPGTGGGKINKTIGSIYNNPTVQDILYGKTTPTNTTGNDEVLDEDGNPILIPKPKPTGGSVSSGRSGGIVDSLIKNFIPIAGGAAAGLFTKNTESDTPGLPNDQTGIQLADLKKTANILDQKQAMAAGLTVPTVASRKYSPTEMIEVYQNAANGGRIGFNNGGGADMGAPQMNNAQVTEEAITKIIQKMQDPNLTDEDRAFLQAQLQNFMPQKQMPMMGIEQVPMMAMGGRIGFEEGGGIMDLGGMEKDYRAEGGFVPIGREEKADDVPARLSVNEFVFTADAVRNAGGGDIDQGAEVMENMMKHLEQGGQVSEESQGMQGARDMFATSERLSEVI